MVEKDDVNQSSSEKLYLLLPNPILLLLVIWETVNRQNSQLVPNELNLEEQDRQLEQSWGDENERESCAHEDLEIYQSVAKVDDKDHSIRYDGDLATVCQYLFAVYTHDIIPLND